jgi:hypothetical protein
MTEHPSSLEEDEEEEVVVEEGTPCHVNPNTGNERGSVRDGGDTTFLPMMMLFWGQEFERVLSEFQWTERRKGNDDVPYVCFALCRSKLSA